MIAFAITVTAFPDVKLGPEGPPTKSAPHPTAFPLPRDAQGEGKRSGVPGSAQACDNSGLGSVAQLDRAVPS